MVMANLFSRPEVEQMTLARAALEVPRRAAHQAKRAASRAARSSFGLKPVSYSNAWSPLHVLCMDMTCIPKRLKFMADPHEP
jgi:hypothetical protein